MAFEVFSKPRTGAVKGSAVTINARGDFSLSRAAHQRLGQPSHVELLFDEEAKQIAFRPVDAATKTSYPVRKSLLVSGLAFTKHFGIDTSVGRRWPADVVDGMLVVDLKAEAVTVTSNRKRQPDGE